MTRRALKTLHGPRSLLRHEGPVRAGRGPGSAVCSAPADISLDGPKFWHNTPGKVGYLKTITPQGDAFYRKLLERVEGLPRVVSAGISHLARQ